MAYGLRLGSGLPGLLVALPGQGRIPDAPPLAVPFGLEEALTFPGVFLADWVPFVLAQARMGWRCSGAG